MAEQSAGHPPDWCRVSSRATRGGDRNRRQGSPSGRGPRRDDPDWRYAL